MPQYGTYNKPGGHYGSTINKDVIGLSGSTKADSDQYMYGKSYSNGKEQKETTDGIKGSQQASCAGGGPTEQYRNVKYD